MKANFLLILKSRFIIVMVTCTGRKFIHFCCNLHHEKLHKMQAMPITLHMHESLNKVSPSQRVKATYTQIYLHTGFAYWIRNPATLPLYMLESLIQFFQEMNTYSTQN